ncbi:MAG: efflux RND transporter periplasmic adaptor subunit [Steroidobacteraceae bacterium]
MDKPIKKNSRSVGQRGLVGAAVLGVLALGWNLFARSTTTHLLVDPQRLTTAIVKRGEFLEYFPFEGTVQPVTSVYLDVEEGGRVETIAVEGGQHVEKGDLILRFSNATLQRTAIETETQLLYNLDIQRNTQFDRAESGMLRRETLLDLEHQIQDTESRFRRYDTLMTDANSPITAEQFETTRNQLKYLHAKRDLLRERIRQEDRLGTRQVAEVRKSIDRLNTSLDLLRRIVRSLEVRAPITGYLSSIDAEVGQNIQPGRRIGQIDLLDQSDASRFKVRTRIDQYYIGRVRLGTPGHLQLDSRAYNVRVQKIYPEVKDNAFAADVVFVGTVPGSVKRGQTVTVELSFGDPFQTLRVAKGAFLEQTASHWVYLVSKDGKTAHRTAVGFGRRNPREVEVLEGLNAGDRIITSGYDTFNAVDELRFTATLRVSQGTT